LKLKSALNAELPNLDSKALYFSSIRHSIKEGVLILPEAVENLLQQSVAHALIRIPCQVPVHSWWSGVGG
jgi:hypothetical protein